MPELPEVENVRLSLIPKLTGRKVETVNILNDVCIKYNDTEDFIKRLIGRRFNAFQRRGKFLIIDMVTDNPEDEVENLIVHLAMVGAFMHTNGDYSELEGNIKNHIFIEFVLDDGNILIYSDYRRFGSLRVVSDSVLNYGDYRVPELRHLKTLREMGPEPFEKDSEDIFLANIRQKKHRYKAVKTVLLDQTVVAGVGNIYANEACFYAATLPDSMVYTLSDNKLREIFQYARETMKLSLSLGGSSIRDYADGDGKKGTFQEHLKVYNQTNCHVCGTEIIKYELDKRATYYCPSCQH